jgi:hypothetical protein
MISMLLYYAQKEIGRQKEMGRQKCGAFLGNIITLISCRQLFYKKAGDMISMLLYYAQKEIR